MRRGLVLVDVLRAEVVAGLVDDRVEVREHAEVGRVLDGREGSVRVRRSAAVGRRAVDVVRGDLVAGGLEGGACTCSGNAGRCRSRPC